MDYIVLDTCIVLHILRNNDYSERSKEAIRNFSDSPAFVLSVITAGELEAMKVFQAWSDKRKSALNSFLEGVTFIDIAHSDQDLLDAYARIDAYSKQKATDKNGNLMPGTHKTMHKNDLWIAATALVLDVPLLTADKGFDHLNGTLLHVIKAL